MNAAELGDGGHDERLRSAARPIGGSAETATHTWSGAPPAARGDAPPASLPDLIDGTYRVVKQLGSGSMGSVVLAHDVRLDRDVAIKLIRPELVASEDAQRRFLQEARAMARVRDPHVVEIHALGDVGGQPYFVMEYVPGTNLEAVLGERGARPLPLDQAIDILDQTCRGVSAIHHSGAVHRDLKPSNVLLGPAGRVAVADLGLARPHGEGRGVEPPELAGTPAYIAPEVAAQRPISPLLAPRVDVYGLGVVAYQLLTGRLPFESDDVDALLAAHANRPPAPLRSIRPELSPALERVVLESLRKDPAHRTASAEHLRASLLEARDAVARSYRGVRVLVADDDPTCARVVAHTLLTSLPGAQVQTVGDGEAALTAMDAMPPSIAVLDLHMPGMNGLELIGALRGNERTARVPVVVMTATGTGRDWRLLSALGAQGFLMKPFDLDQMVTTVRGVLSRHDLPRRG